jgi:hypothetical protein
MAASLLEHLSWPELLRRWSGEAIGHCADIGLTITAGARASGWIGMPPASASGIAAAEARLGRALPPSYKSFLAVTDGWPVLSMDYGSLRPVSGIAWMRDAQAGLLGIIRDASGDFEWPPDSNDGPPLLERSVLLSTGTDMFLLDPARTGLAGELFTCVWTSWHPGAGEHWPSFRAGMEGHYASFVRFSAPDSITHDEVARAVEDAYCRLLRGDRSRQDVISSARHFGSDRADVLEIQVRVLTSQYRAATSMVTLSRAATTADPALRADLWPMFVAAALDPRNRARWALDQVISTAGELVAGLVRSLAGQYLQGQGLTADFSYAPDFARAVSNARVLARQGRDDEAFTVIVDALPLWRPLSPLHLAPMGVAWDRDLAHLMTPHRLECLLATARGHTSDRDP